MTAHPHAPSEATRRLLASLHTRTLDGCVALHARLSPDKPAVLDRMRSFTYAELEGAVGRVAAHLVRLGLRPGGVVVAFPRRTWELPVLFLATARAGGVFAPLDGRADAARLDAVLRWPGVQLAFVPPEHDGPAELAVAALGHPSRVIRSGASERHPSLDDLVDRPVEPLQPSTDADAVCYLNFTSGSTGLPKGAPTTHANVQWNTRACLETYPDFSEREVFLCLFAPFAHPHEHWARAVAIGATCVMVNTIRPKTILRAIQDCKVTWLFAIPTVFELLVAAASAEGRPFESHLRRGESGGAVVTPELSRLVEQALGVSFLPIWGCTESTGVVLHVPPWEADRRLDMLGKPVKHYEVRVVHADADTGVGELCVRGGAVVAGYRDRPDQTSEKFRDGWYHTGDLVREEDGGYFRFMGRREEMIKVGGEKVYLLEIERAIGELEGVRQVVVVAMNDPMRGEVPRAVLVRSPGADVTVDDVLRHCRDRLPPAGLPRRVEFWDELPAGPSGKIDKRAVTARVSRDLAVAVNSMIIGSRPLEEVFRLAAGLKARAGCPVYVDLRSRRAPESDPRGTWAVAHHNADFDLADPVDVQRAIELAEAYDLEIASVSAYFGAAHPDDEAYGTVCIDHAVALAERSPGGTVVLRVLGGDLWARARSMPGRWQDVRGSLRDECLARILAWEAHARMRAAESGRKVVLGLEIHHGQYLADLTDLHHACRGLRDTNWEQVGFLEDPANRLIAGEGDPIGSMDFARIIRAMGGRILGYHVKDVRYVSPWSQFHPQPLQRVGDLFFVWGMHKYEWAPLGAGEVDLPQALMAAATLSDPPHDACLVSTEYVAASADEAEAAAILDTYLKLVRDGRAPRSGHR